MANLKFFSKIDIDNYLYPDDMSNFHFSNKMISGSLGEFHLYYQGGYERIYDPSYNSMGIQGSINNLYVLNGFMPVMKITNVCVDFGEFYGKYGANEAFALLTRGNDIIRGSRDNDRLIGNDGNDVIYGNRGDDSLFGGNGDDVLKGGLGRDNLYGGEGNDTYVFANIRESKPGYLADSVFFFEKGDPIDLSRIDARSDLPGNQAFRFIGEEGFSGQAGELQASNFYVMADTDGDGNADFALRIQGSLSIEDFIL